jgi:hypothetical protein
MNRVYQKPYPLSDDVTELPKTGGMIGLLCFVLAALASPFKSKIQREKAGRREAGLVR